MRSITSRGSAEMDLFFDWNVDMFQTLQLRGRRGGAACSQALPPTAKIETHRLTFASFPIIGYSLTSDTVPQTQLWEMATYEIKPRLNRLDGVASVLVQGGQEPEFQIAPDPAKLLQAGVTVTDILDAIAANQPDRLARACWSASINSSWDWSAGRSATPEEIAAHRGEDHAGGHSGAHRRRWARSNASVKPVYTIVTANGKPAVLLSINRQPDSNTVQVARRSARREWSRSARRCRQASQLEPFYDQSTIVSESIESVRDADADRADSGVDHPGAVSARLGNFAGGRPGDSGDHAGDASSR